jgi:hypothetical protein
VKTFSIRFRLTVWYATIFAVTFAGLAGGVWLAVQHSIRSVVDKDLRSRLQPMRHYIKQQMRGGDYSHLRQELSEDVDTISADSSVQILSTNGTWIYRSPETEAWDQRVPGREDLPIDGKTSTIVVRGQRIRVLLAPLAIGVPAGWGVAGSVPRDGRPTYVDDVARQSLIASSGVRDRLLDEQSRAETSRSTRHHRSKHQCSESDAALTPSRNRRRVGQALGHFEWDADTLEFCICENHSIYSGCFA